MNKELHNWLRRIQRHPTRVHDDHWELSDQLIAMGLVEVDEEWVYEGKVCRFVKAVR